MSDEAEMAVSNAQNPSAVHALIVPTMPIATDNGMGRIERPALVPRSELERVERELAEARENWNRVSLEAEHWLSLSSQRKDEIDGLREQRNAAENLAGQVDVLKCRIAELKGRLERSCVWTEDSETNWDTSCGECFSFSVGGKHAVYCCHCGGKIVAKEWRHEQLED